MAGNEDAVTKRVSKREQINLGGVFPIQQLSFAEPRNSINTGTLIESPCHCFYDISLDSRSFFSAIFIFISVSFISRQSFIIGRKVRLNE